MISVLFPVMPWMHIHFDYVCLVFMKYINEYIIEGIGQLEIITFSNTLYILKASCHWLTIVCRYNKKKSFLTSPVAAACWLCLFFLSSLVVSSCIRWSMDFSSSFRWVRMYFWWLSSFSWSLFSFCLAVNSRRSFSNFRGTAFPLPALFPSPLDAFDERRSSSFSSSSRRRAHGERGMKKEEVGG